MSDDKGNHRSTSSPGDREVLVNLPQTRPQRSSARRTAAREAAAGTGAPRRAPGRAAARSRIGGGTATQGGPRKPARAPASRAPASKRARTAGKRPTSSAPRRDAAPRQGFESESENMNGSVQPPGGAELVVSAAEIVGELAKVGLSAGERLLKDAFSRLPRS